MFGNVGFWRPNYVSYCTSLVLRCIRNSKIQKYENHASEIEEIRLITHKNPWSRPYHCVSRPSWTLFLCSQFLPFFVHLANSYSSLKRQLKYHLPCKNFLHSPTSVAFPKACFGPCVASNMAVGLHIGSLPLTASPLSLRNGPAHFCNSSIWQRWHTGGTHAMLVGLSANSGLSYT